MVLAALARKRSLIKTRSATPASIGGGGGGRKRARGGCGPRDARRCGRCWRRSPGTREFGPTRATS
eukprot:8680728-Pyramimonas_sp.AAC.1